MNASHYRLPAELVQLIAARLRPAASSEKAPSGSLSRDLSDARIVELLDKIMAEAAGETLTPEKCPPGLSREEQALKDSLLREIRTRPIKLTLKSSGSPQEVLSRTG